jgi:hypothetical protein
VSDSPRVYLLYHPDDLDIAKRLGTVLRAEHGIDVWLDVWEIAVGDSEIGRIEDAIENSDGGLVLLSNHGLGAELDRGIYAALLKRAFARGKYIIPIRHGDVPKVPVLLEDRRSVDAGNEEAIRRAILRKHALIGSDKPQVNPSPTNRAPASSPWRIPDELEQLRSWKAPLILYVGPELSTAAQLPSRRELAELLLAQLPEYTSDKRRATLRKYCTAPDLTDAFTELQRELGEQRFGRIVEHAVDDSRFESLPELAWAIARLRPKVQGVITPNLDNLLERAFKGNLSPHHAVTPGLANDDGWLLKIHGTRTSWSSWVLTREQFDRALYRDPALAEIFRALFIGKSILFIGTPIDDPISTEVIDRVRAMTRGGKAPRHWALLPETEADPVVRRKLEEAGISVIPYKDEAERLDILESLE